MKQASMERKILSYSISLALCLLMFLPLRAQNGNPTAPPQGAPPKKEKKDAKEEVHYPLSVSYTHLTLPTKLEV